ncbi:MAG: hypothetical protein KC736_03770 [Candidatus Moranbacteria bacterium]|nr:hypothetical protein [Candidatus Moranbacteria bacterium]
MNFVRKDTRNAFLPLFAIVVVSIVSSRVYASIEDVEYVRDAYQEKAGNPEYWQSLKDQHVLQKEVFEEAEQARLSAIADVVQAESDEEARRIASQKAAELAAQQRAQEAAAQATAVQKKTVQKKSRQSKAS